MPDIFQLIKGTSAYIEIGVVDSILGENAYSVKIGSRLLSVKSAISDQLYQGSSVVINRTEIGRYIVGTTNVFKNQHQQEVIING